LNDKTTKTDVLTIIEQKGNVDELVTDIKNITSNVGKFLKEFKSHKEDCMSFNEAMLKDNSFGRWLWTRADVVNQGEFLAWDTESANTHPQNYRWWKPQQKEH
jgi:hypothetical protein